MQYDFIVVQHAVLSPTDVRLAWLFSDGVTGHDQRLSATYRLQEEVDVTRPDHFLGGLSHLAVVPIPKLRHT